MECFFTVLTSCTDVEVEYVSLIQCCDIHYKAKHVDLYVVVLWCECKQQVSEYINQQQQNVNII